MKKKQTAKKTMLKNYPKVFFGFFRICLIAYIDYYQIITALKAGPNGLNFF